MTEWQMSKLHHIRVAPGMETGQTLPQQKLAKICLEVIENFKRGLVPKSRAIIQLTRVRVITRKIGSSSSITDEIAGRISPCLTSGSRKPSMQEDQDVRLTSGET